MRVAVISVHGCPLLAPGSREVGGMNVYLAALCQELTKRGLEIDVFTRRHDDVETPQVIVLQPNLRVIHLEAGGRGPRSKEELYPYLPEFLHHLVAFVQGEGLRYQLIHSHYWLSGWVGTFLRHRWRVPHVVMFHTLGMVKNQARVGEHESLLRIQTEQKIMHKADAIVVATSQEREQTERLYRVEDALVRVISGGVDLELFRPMNQRVARQELGLNGEKILLFVGRPDPFKGLPILLSAASELEHPAGIRVLVVGGAQDDAEESRYLQEVADQSAIGERVSFLGHVAHIE